jgi:hypothetical protein
MTTQCHIEEIENRELDFYDLVEVLELFKEHNLKEIWRRYCCTSPDSNVISLNLETEGYVIETDVQILTSLALSAKYNTTPNILQGFIRRVLCGHRHELILSKLASYGLKVSNPEEINLSLSVGDIALDFLCRRLQDAPEYRFQRFGTSRVEQDELRPLDYFDVVSILYFASQNLTDHVIRHYVPQEILEEGSEAEKIVRINTVAGDHRIALTFERITNDIPRQIPSRGNVSLVTMHQFLTRLMARHPSALLVRELNKKGIRLTEEEMAHEFILERTINDNHISLHCQPLS